MCGWKDRCRDGNLRTYCHVSPILFGCFFVEASPTCFCIFVKCFFCNLFPGDFFGEAGFFQISYILSMNFFLRATCFCCFLGVTERSFAVVLLGRNCSQGKLKLMMKLIYLMMLLQAAMIVKSLPKYMYMYCPALSSNICLPIKILRNAITKDKGMYGSL